MKGNQYWIAMYKIKFLFLKNEIHLDQDLPIQWIMKRINFKNTLNFTIYNKQTQKEVIV